MALIQWRRFNFFNKQIVDPGLSGRTWQHVKDRQFLCSACGRGQLVFGDSQGCIHSVNHNFQVSSFKAFEIVVTHLFQLKQHNILAAVGVDEMGINPVIKVWNLDKKDKLGNPFCCRVQNTIPSNNVPSEVTDFAVHENLTLMAVSFVQGSVVLYKGDIAKDRITNKNVHLTTDVSDPITGLSFYGVGKNIHLFATTERMLFTFNLQEKSPKKNVLDRRGCPPRCSMSSDSILDNQFILTATDAVYLYHPDSVGSCFVFEGEKIMAKWGSGYLVLVYKDKAKGSIPTTSTMRLLDKNVVTIYDMKQKLIAYSAPLPGVQEVLYEWGSIYILGADNSLVCLQEIDIHQKLEMLFKKNLYSLAVNLAKSQNLGEEGLVEIFTQYGDHLYSKGDFDNAITQYIRTIGHLEPSYIIRKFLDAQRIHNLASYLQALHEKGMANEDHTTLLLNCFTKLKDVENLNKFIMTPETELHFDVETAIKVCRQAGYHQHALQLAEKHHKHKWYLKIQLEDTHQYEKALAYIKKLPFKEAESTVKQYGKVLMCNVPEETTHLLKNLCTDYRPIGSQPSDDADGRPISKSNGEEFIHIFVNTPEMLVKFLEHLIQADNKPSEAVFNTLLELYLHKMNQTDNAKKKVDIEETTLKLLKDFSSKSLTDQALVLCQMHNFRPGILYLYEAQGLYQQILRYHMDHEAHGLIVETCRRHGDRDVTLWQHALTYFAQQRDSDCRQHIAQVLTHIEKHNLLPPLLVIQLLSRNPSTTLSVVKDYILRRIRQESDEIKKYERSIEEHRETTEKMKKNIEALKTSATIFQETKCSLCTHDLELPAVHFLCQHAYHQHCFESYAENDDECPVCAGPNRKIMESLKEQEQTLSSSLALNEQFLSQLKRSSDGFSVIADFFSKGVFNKLTLVGDEEKIPNGGGARATSSGSMTSHRIDPSLQKELLMMQQANRM
uniref:Vacuolar protein sorting-associated protein 11 homolog n=1 Tax=Phallusia mammillata TaxID=59560 RepID=A0A6F9DX84_9ASCI|nr:vacuolar protein sorting-associated protein 11 homolog [Phallusia mammillata]